MIPLKVDTRGARTVVFSWLFGFVCIAALVRLVTLPTPIATDLMYRLAVVPKRLWDSGLISEDALTLLTSTMLHAGWFHLLGNMLFLGVFGPSVESRLGCMPTAVLMTGAGACGAIAFALLNPDSGVPLVGASGAIAGLLGSQLITAPRARVTTFVPAFISIEIASLPALFVVGLWFATQVASQVASVSSVAGAIDVAWVSHITGFIAGMVLTVMWRLAQPRGLRTSPKRKSR